MGCEAVNLQHLTQIMVQWLFLLNKVIKLATVSMKQPSLICC